MRWLKRNPAIVVAALLSLLWTGGAITVFSPLLYAQGANTLQLRDANSGSNPTLTVNGVDTNIGIALTPKGTGSIVLNGPIALTGNQTITGNLAVTGNISATGTLSVGQSNVTKQYFVRAVDHCRADSTLILTTRLAQSDWALTRTAAGAETYNYTCNIPLPIQTVASKGIRVDSFAIAQQITVVNLTSNTFQALATITYANNAANVINATYGGAVTITTPTLVQAAPYLTAATLATPAFQITANTAIVLDWQAVLANTGVYRVYGIVVNYTEAQY